MSLRSWISRALWAAVVLSPASAFAQSAPDAGGADAGAVDDPPVETPETPEVPETPAEDAGASEDASADAAPNVVEDPETSGGGAGAAPRAEDAAETRAAPLTAEQRATMVPSAGELPDLHESAPHRVFFPPYLYEWGSGHETRVVFPFFFQSRVNDDRWLLVPPYYQYRSPTQSRDAVFPFFYWSRGTTSEGARFSTVVTPLAWSHGSDGPERARSRYFGAIPLFSYGEVFDRRGRLDAEHLVIPAALTFHRWTPQSQTTITPFFQTFRDRQSRTSAVGPVVPLAVWHSSPRQSWQLLWPLLTFHRSNHETNTHLTVVGPFWTESTPTARSVNVAPLFFHRSERNFNRTTIAPFFHYQHGPDHTTFATLLGGYSRVGNESTLILPFYQQHRGSWQLDAVAPLFVSYRNPRLGVNTFSILNFVHSTRPTGYSWGLFPLIGRFHEEGRYDTTITPLAAHSYDVGRRASTTWVFPSIHVERSPEHHVTNVYPIWYSARGRTWHHNVFFPFVWDVGDRAAGRQTTVIAPFYANVSDRTGFTRWAFPNVFWWSHQLGEERNWGYDISPFFQYNEPRRGDYAWSVLYGLVGYRRQGSYEQTKVFWATVNNTIPVTRRTTSSARPINRAAQPDVLLEM